MEGVEESGIDCLLVNSWLISPTQNSMRHIRAFCMYIHIGHCPHNKQCRRECIGVGVVWKERGGVRGGGRAGATNGIAYLI